MPDEVTADNSGAEAASQQPAAAEVNPAAPSQTQSVEQQPAAGSPSWKFGGNTYTDPNKLYEAASKWEADFTRKSQGWASKEKDYADRLGKYEAVVSAIRSDPQLTQQVIAKMQAGMTQRQAVESTAQQMDPAVSARIESLEKAELDRAFDSAVSEFEAKYKDLTEEDKDAIVDWLKANESEFGPATTKEAFLKRFSWAYYDVVAPKRQAALISMGQKQKAEEVQNGKKSSFLGSQAPTAGANAAKAPERKRHMTPAEERAYAHSVWERNSKK